MRPTPIRAGDGKGRPGRGAGRNNMVMITIAPTPTTTGAHAGRAWSRPKIVGRRAASSVTAYAAIASNPSTTSFALTCVEQPELADPFEHIEQH